MRVHIDIETIPQQPEDSAKELIAKEIKAPAAMKKQETIDDWHSGAGKYAYVKDKAIEDKYRATSFDASKGQICSIAFAVDDDDIISYSSDAGCDGDLLQDFFDDLDHRMSGKAPFFIGHYIAGFDLKFIFHRSVINGIRPPFKLPFNGRHDQDFYDNMIAWSGFKDRISQDDLCRALGIEGKPGDINGSKVWDFYKAGGIKKIDEYNRDDVEKSRLIYKRINFISEIS